MAGLAGLALAGALLAAGRGALIEAAAVEPFRVEVASPHAPAADGRWAGRVVPPELAARVVVRVDGEIRGGPEGHAQKDMSAARDDSGGHALEAMSRVAEVDGHGAGTNGRGPEGHVYENMFEGTLSVALGDAPGLRLIEVELPRQGGAEVATDAALVGPFRARYDDSPGCGAGVRVAARAIDRLVLPPLRDKLLAAAPSIGLLGPGTTLEEASVTLRGDALWFRVALAGEHRIAVSGALEVRVAGPRQLGVRLASLGPVEFTGTLRTRATLGAAGLGAIVTGPLAPLGALAGYALADGYIDRRARQEVETQLTAALAVASAIPLIPERAELIVGEPRSRATLAFCAVAIESGGIAAHLSVRPDKPDPKTSQEASRVRTRLAAIPGPARHGLALPPLRPVAPTADAEVELSLDTVDALLDAWTANGLLGDLMGRAQWVERVDEALGEWTTLGLAEIEVRLPPSLSPGTGDGWALTVAGLRLGLTGSEGEDPGEVLVAGRGFVRPHYDARRGRLALAGTIDRLRLSCARAGALWPCFAALLEMGDVEARLDALLAPGAAGLPGIEVRALLRDGTRALRDGGLELADLAISYPQPGVLRVAAEVR
ncbi:hypothetical protein OV079_05310 [Nannocystis pusilla]|uniref:AsmA-like C-terminal domain-containing protein n=1 Tax=Nannocystis pusilla TaxID=889268 RepID=A0A9X3EIY0_9BACT|nr:hypothetical protein [Nannocystis pusilla]MCY1004999.1 hypothetical protein [Nannocystis pusilla]